MFFVGTWLERVPAFFIVTYCLPPVVRPGPAYIYAPVFRPSRGAGALPLEHIGGERVPRGGQNHQQAAKIERARHRRPGEILEDNAPRGTEVSYPKGGRFYQ